MFMFICKFLYSFVNVSTKLNSKSFILQNVEIGCIQFSEIFIQSENKDIGQGYTCLATPAALSLEGTWYIPMLVQKCLKQEKPQNSFNIEFFEVFPVSGHFLYLWEFVLCCKTVTCTFPNMCGAKLSLTKRRQTTFKMFRWKRLEGFVNVCIQGILLVLLFLHIFCTDHLLLTYSRDCAVSPVSRNFWISLK